MRRRKWVLILALLGLAGACRAADSGRPDILVADFEGPDYGPWRTTGEAFGPGPAQGTLRDQMPVSGYRGHGLVNSYYHGDGTVGTLTSPPLRLERRYLIFLIGGGGWTGKTCMNLLVAGRIVRTAAGPNRRPGGTERLQPFSWDVSDLEGQAAVLQMVDNERGGWGHINVDDIIQSDRPVGVLGSGRPLTVDRPYLAFVMPPRATTMAHVTLLVDNVAVRDMAGSDSGQPLAASWDVSRFRGRPAWLITSEAPQPDGSCPLRASCALSDQPRGIAMEYDKPYHEVYRPQFHFTARKNWHNDPNGLMFYQGEYHLFFQHNPDGIDWGNMTWGHAVSPDLVHWTQLDHAIHPDALGTIFSGSGVVDWNNTTGFATGPEKPLVCIYTSAGDPFTQSIAYSNDRGRTWTKYGKNPVLGHIAGSNRDPKVIWHQPTGRWVMALYLDGNDYALFASPNLKAWTKLCDVHVPGAAECPDFFELPVDGNPKSTRWVFWGANHTYLLGTFDGQVFKAESGPHPSHWGGNCYAAQTWSDIPPSDGRRLQIAWMAGGTYPDMPFNQQMSFPCELSLHTTPEGIRLFRRPVREIELLHAARHAWADLALKPGENPLQGLSGELIEIRAVIEPGRATEVGFSLRGERVAYSVAQKQLTCLGHSAPLEPQQGRVQLQILLDRTSLEVFGNDGRVSLATCFLPNLADRSLAAYCVGGEARLVSLEVYELKSAWSSG